MIQIFENDSCKICRSPHYSYNFNKQNGYFERWGATQEDDPQVAPFPELLDIEISSSSIEDINKGINREGILTTNGGCSGKHICGNSLCYKRNISDKTVHTSLDLFKKILDRFITYVKIYDYNGNVYEIFPDIEIYDDNNHNRKLALFELKENQIIYSPIYFNCNGFISYRIHIKKLIRKYGTQQIALGLTSIDSHPQLWEICEEIHNRDLISNVTVNGIGLTDSLAEKLAFNMGAVAVSVNPKNKEIAYDAIKKLSIDNKMSQINIHIVLAEETVDFIRKVANDIKNDQRLSKMNALVMLSFKDKAKTGFYSPITFPSYSKLIEELDSYQIRYGFDSCSAVMYEKYIQNKPNRKELAGYCEKCESGLFSFYGNVFGEFFACSFCEGLEEWKEGFNILEYDNIYDIWNSEKVKGWRKRLLGNNRNCPFYHIGNCNDRV